MSLDCSQSKLPGNVLDVPSAPFVTEVEERGTGESWRESLAALQPLGAERRRQVGWLGKSPHRLDRLCGSCVLWLHALNSYWFQFLSSDPPARPLTLPQTSLLYMSPHCVSIARPHWSRLSSLKTTRIHLHFPFLSKLWHKWLKISYCLCLRQAGGRAAGWAPVAIHTLQWTPTFLGDVPLSTSVPSSVQLCARLEAGKRLSTSCVFVFQYYVGYSGCFVSLHKLQNQFLRIHKTTHWGFDWNCIDSTDWIGKNWHLDNIESLCPWT